MSFTPDVQWDYAFTHSTKKYWAELSSTCTCMCLAKHIWEGACFQNLRYSTKQFQLPKTMQRILWHDMACGHLESYKWCQEVISLALICENPQIVSFHFLNLVIIPHLFPADPTDTINQMPTCSWLFTSDSFLLQTVLSFFFQQNSSNASMWPINASSWSLILPTGSSYISLFHHKSFPQLPSRPTHLPVVQFLY